LDHYLPHAKPRAWSAWKGFSPYSGEFTKKQTTRSGRGSMRPTIERAADRVVAQESTIRLNVYVFFASDKMLPLTRRSVNLVCHCADIFVHSGACLAHPSFCSLMHTHSMVCSCSGGNSFLISVSLIAPHVAGSANSICAREGRANGSGRGLG
jgi:hypothetical protein